MRLATTLRYAGDPRSAALQAAGWEAAGLDALSGGRAMLGLGASDPQPRRRRTPPSRRER